MRARTVVTDSSAVLGGRVCRGRCALFLRGADAACTAMLTSDRPPAVSACDERRDDREDLVGSLLRSSA
ncbi:hypothetical protein P2Q00_22360 [Streptomyces coacervatus]|uniref:hypothetical protein n=1 Tax=Streptomyces coacervatus TaxID=647381 RepID=UPI0023DB5E46|nr:hypothetical protein [Streptomyces coacervatus]MDF2268160.1 hypothetical protein [Streptomyces coacervatus]